MNPNELGLVSDSLLIKMLRCHILEIHTHHCNINNKNNRKHTCVRFRRVRGTIETGRPHKFRYFLIETLLPSTRLRHWAHSREPERRRSLIFSPHKNLLIYSVLITLILPTFNCVCEDDTPLVLVISGQRIVPNLFSPKCDNGWV